ncbi:hypothetical protein [Salinicola avicenniae]|uniref:hypothetical protein n=1 Tax=Salinicola avicenniae TaxID=2916836 RepID=UPI002073B131|nr:MULTISPECIES: hypothetical protein [unclassified Salinicola]
MNQRPILPATAAGRLVLALFVLVILAGLWPTVLLVNQAALVLGLPMLGAWACLIVIASTAVMLLGNRLLPLPDAIANAHPEASSVTEATSHE